MYDDDLLPTAVAVGAGGAGAPTALALTGSNTLFWIGAALSALMVGLVLLRLAAQRSQNS